MAHGGYARRRIAERRPLGRRSRGLGLDKRRNKSKRVSIKNQIRSVERFLRKDLLDEVRKAQEQKLEELKQQQELQTRLELEHKIRLRDKKIKFFERRKVERMIRRLEKQQRTSSDHASDERILDQLSKLKEDLNYVCFFPKTEKYVSLFAGGDNPAIVDKRNKLRQQVKANLIAAAASGKDLEAETASDDDALDVSEDDFFLSGSSTDEAEADDEWTDKSTRELTSSTSGKATSSMSSDERNQRLLSARALMPPPRSLPSNRNQPMPVENIAKSTSSNTSNSCGPSSKSSRFLNGVRSQNSNASSGSDARKPHRKRRPKKKKQAL